MYATIFGGLKSLHFGAAMTDVRGWFDRSPCIVGRWVNSISFKARAGWERTAAADGFLPEWSCITRHTTVWHREREDILKYKGNDSLLTFALSAFVDVLIKKRNNLLRPIWNIDLKFAVQLFCVSHIRGEHFTGSIRRQTQGCSYEQADVDGRLGADKLPNIKRPALWLEAGCVGTLGIVGD